MKKVLKYYWYIAKDGWHNIYDTHLRNLAYFKDVFDEYDFIISVDYGIDNGAFVNMTIKRLKEIFPDARFWLYQNDPETRESNYFYHEIVEKIDTFGDDVAIFFAHNKGAGSTYCPLIDCEMWVDTMYYYNLNNVDSLLSDEKICMVGHYKQIANLLPYCKYGWQYPGTFFWIVPSRVKNFVKNTNKSLPNWIDRYSTEGFAGAIFRKDDPYCVAIKPERDPNDSVRYWLKKNITEEELNGLTKINGDIFRFDSNSALDIFVFANKQFETERTNRIYKIVTSSDCDITNDNLEVLKFDCRLSNIGFSEWQKIYEVYKHPYLLKDYVGLANYHGYLRFSDDINFVPDVDELMRGVDVMTNMPLRLGNLRSQYEFCHNVEDYDAVMRIVKAIYPSYSEAIEIAEKAGVLISSNIMILRRKTFMDMCNFVFSILFVYCKLVGINPFSDDSFVEYVKKNQEKYEKKHLPDNDEYLQQTRICSYLAERLVMVFFTAKKLTLSAIEMVEK